MALAAIDSGLTSLEAAYAERLFRWQDMAIEKIGQAVRLDSGARVLETGSLRVGAVDELKADLLSIRIRIAGFGRGQVNEELKRQMR